MHVVECKRLFSNRSHVKNRIIVLFFKKIKIKIDDVSNFTNNTTSYVRRGYYSIGGFVPSVVS